MNFSLTIVEGITRVNILHALGLKRSKTMPAHDWTRVISGTFHHFHHDWISAISRTLNAGLLPTKYYALAEQIVGGLGPDVLTLGTSSGTDEPLSIAACTGGLERQAFIEPFTVGKSLPDMPLFLQPPGHVMVPLESTYQTAFEGVPGRWRRELV